MTNFKIYTIPEFEIFYHESRRSPTNQHLWETLPIKRFNLTKKKVVKKRKTETVLNQLEIPVVEVISNKVTKDAFDTNMFTKLIILYLQTVHNCKSVRRISSEGRARKIKGKLQRIKGLNTGMEDLQATLKGRLFAIEVKSPTDTQKEAQEERMKAVRADGGVYIIATGFEQVQAEIINCLTSAK